MKMRTALLLLAVILLTVLPLVWVPTPPAAADGQKAAIFGGSDDKARNAISEIAPGYKPWFAPLLEPASGEIASLLFALQAAIGAGVIGYWLGYSTKGKLTKADAANTQAGKTGQSGTHAD